MRHRRFSLIAAAAAAALILSVLIVFTINYFWYNSIQSAFTKNSAIIRDNYLYTKKQQIKFDVDQFIKNIDNVRISESYNIKDILYYRSNSGLNMVKDIYNRYKNSYGKDEIKEFIKGFLCDDRFYYGNGFYLIFLKNGNIIGDPELELDKISKNKIIRLFNHFNEEFIREKMRDGKEFTGYVKSFKPLDIYIIACVFNNAVKKRIKEKIISSLSVSNSDIDKNRYIFMNSKNGDAIVSGKTIFNNGVKLWNIYTTQKSIKRIRDVFRKELSAYKTNNGKFITYDWYEPKTEKLSRKISFVKGYKPWGWIIGEGFYEDKAYLIIESIKMQIQKTAQDIFRKSYVFAIAIILIVLAVVYILFIFVRKKSERIFGEFEKSFANRRKINESDCRISEFSNITRYINSSIDKFSKYEDEFLEAFSYAMEARDSYTKGHSQRVAKYSKIIATALGFDEMKQEEIYKAGLLHDIGKIGIPDNILLKPGKLTPNEYRIVKYHAVFSYEIVHKITQFGSMAGYIRHHHERCDGSGYPDGLKCSAIETEARILAVADVFDALTSKRSYRKKLTVEQAVEILKKEQLDQDIVNKAANALTDNYIGESNTETHLHEVEEANRIRHEMFDIDYMTGLTRRRVFIEKADKIIESGQAFTLFMVDIKLLSFINYKFSTKAGDKVIIYTAISLSEILKEKGYNDAFLSRAYNDAFLFLVKLNNENDLSKLQGTAENLRGEMIKKVKDMIDKNDKGKYIDEKGECVRKYINFHVIYCTYPYEADAIEKMIYVCTTKKTLSPINIKSH